MRNAKISDVWRGLDHRTFQHRVSKFSYDQLVGVGTGQMDFPRSITAICGANGAGKTTILNALGATLVKNDTDIPADLRGKLQSADMTTDVSIATGSLSRRLLGSSLHPPELDINLLRLNPSKDVMRLLETLHSSENVAGLKEGVDPKEADDSERANLSHIVGRFYDRVLTYELEPEGDEIVPYFEVEVGESSYDTFSMGLGELCVHLILWRLRRAAAESIVLIEEPETFLAPLSQSGILDEIANLSLRGGHWFVLTTHSESILRNIPFQQVRLLSRAGNTIEISQPKSSTDYLVQLGIPPRIKGVILVEDRVASVFARALIVHFRPRLLEEFEITVCHEGASAICNALSFPKLGSWMHIVGLLDGDEAVHDHSHSGKSVWPHCFLPGNDPPELLLQKMCTSAPADVATRLGIPYAGLQPALAATEGLDHHDWLPELAKRTGLSFEVLTYKLFEAWLQDAANVALAEQSYGSIADAFGT